ncbi:hypothetical protein QVD17_20293 [Tagetes erecta]|uniref:Uncharacterized protein n=1 Tax=Tagetes erecta TaxID=13708 RepID=A0AAD8NXS0_TARER|nr:hypothetical protein QVD17_20293 [Tagetes erecta]
MTIDQSTHPGAAHRPRRRACRSGCGVGAAPHGNTAPLPIGAELWGVIWGLFPVLFPEDLNVELVGPVDGDGD